jgi:hypothetical protein
MEGKIMLKCEEKNLSVYPSIDVGQVDTRLLPSIYLLNIDPLEEMGPTSHRILKLARPGL